MLTLIIHPKARPPVDPATNKPIDSIEERITQLLEDWEAQAERIVVPTPVLTEFLVLADKEAPKYLDLLTTMKNFMVRPYDEMSAIELAAMELADRGKGDKRGGSTSAWQKVKFDRQIVATCKVNGVHTVYANDKDLLAFAKKAGMDVIALWELPIPPSKQPLLDTIKEPPIELGETTRRIRLTED